MSDLISRQDAIDTLAISKEFLLRVLDDTDIVGQDREKYSWGLGLIESFINDVGELPSAEPEKKLIAEVKMSKEDIQSAVDEAVARIKADLERKKGKWEYGEKSGQDGWYCSECGGFIPWYYDFYGLDNIDFIENFKTCPFCDSKMVSYTGADMRGEQDEIHC